MLCRTLTLLLLLTAATIAMAAPDAVVEGIQFPAWVTRDGRKMPLQAGAPLQRADEVSTGANARLLLRLGDGSAVKLGENGRLQLAQLAQNRKENLLTATLKVLEGAFRFTTETLARQRSRREVDVQFTTVTAGIRGTDIWGKNLGDREVVVLIEGHITVSRTGENPVDMKDALTYLQAPRGAPTTVEPVPAEQLKAWATETEIAAGQGAARAGGTWKVYAATLPTSREALGLYDRLRAEGYPARIVPQDTDGKPAFQVRISGLPSEAEAGALGRRLQALIPELQPRVSR